MKLGTRSGIIIALDITSIERAKSIVTATHQVKGITGYKLGFSLALSYGLPTLVQAVRAITSLPLIYDHQKAGTDIPDTASLFAHVCSIVDGIILFPQAGPETLKAWVKAIRDTGKTVIMGTEMTHKSYLASDGGYLIDDAPEQILKLAISLGVSHFVVPGNKPERITHYQELISQAGVSNPVLYSPGIITQGGNLLDGIKLIRNTWQAIIGRAILEAQDPAKKARELAAAFS